MSHLSGYIYDPAYDEYYVPDKFQCENCSNEAVIGGLCKECYGTEIMLIDESEEIMNA